MRISGRKGFTLIEMVIALVIVGIISLVTAQYIFQAFTTWAFINGQKSMGFSDRSALYRMVSEIRAVPATSKILTYTSGTFSFIDAGNNTVTFSQSGTNLMRNSDVLANDLASPGGLAFSYFDPSGAAAATKDAISTVRIDLSTVKGNNKFSARSSAHLRVN